jgi:hypothetical protein
MTRSGRPPILDALREKRNVMTAVMLRDMRTRFFNNGLIPTHTFMNVSWSMSPSLILNRPMLAFPVVKSLDKEYLTGFGMASLCLGLLMERMLRRIMLEG